MFICTAAHETSPLQAGHVLRSEVNRTEQLDNQLIQSLTTQPDTREQSATQPDGGDGLETSTVASEVSVDDNISTRLKVCIVLYLLNSATPLTYTTSTVASSEVSVDDNISTQLKVCTVLCYIEFSTHPLPVKGLLTIISLYGSRT